MTLKLRDPLSGQLVALKPVETSFKVYICGVTPYDATHLGHVATFLTYDVLARRLQELGHQVDMVRNITDLDEPVLPKAQSLKVAYWDLVETEIVQFRRDMQALGMLPTTREPRVSEHLGQVTDLISEICATGATYRVGGTTYFDAGDAPLVGELFAMPPRLQLYLAESHGGDPDDPNKRHPLDFILWRPARPGEPSYESPFGPGMPGWHIGCSAMARQLLGARVDLHGGGKDLRFPHHACEHAQLSAVQARPFVRTWHHCGLVTYHGAKMSKSLGNIVLARDLLKTHDPRAVRLAILRQYRYAVGTDWRDGDIQAAEALLELLVAAAGAPAGPDPRPWAARIRAAIDDDLDFPTAVAHLESMARATLLGGYDRGATSNIVELAGLMGVNVGADVR